MMAANLKLIHAGWAALNGSDADAFVAALHPDVEWELTEQRFPGFRATYRGQAEVRQWLEAAVGGPWGSTRYQVEEITEASDDRVLVGSLLTARGESSAVETELRMWDVISFADGKVIRRRVRT